MYIYIDVLIITNIYAVFFIVKACSKFTHTPIKNIRAIISAIFGSLFSLLILMDELNVFAILLIRIISACLVVFFAFGRSKFLQYYRLVLIYFFVSFILAGSQYVISTLFTGKTLWHNSVLYVNISLITLVFSTILTYFTISILRWFFDSSNELDNSFTITILHNNCTAKINAVSDSCNNLTDSFSGKPVIVCPKTEILSLFPNENLDNILCSFACNSSFENTNSIIGWRLIPYSTINSNGILPSFLPSNVFIKNNCSGKITHTNAYIGVLDGDIYNAIFNPKIL